MFYDNLKKITDSKKTSPSAVALAIGINKSNVTKWKAGQMPKMDNIVAMAEYLGVSIWDLIDKEKPATNEDDGLSDIDKEIMDIFKQLSLANKKSILALAKDLPHLPK